MSQVGRLISRTIPRPGQVPLQIPEGLRVLLLSNSLNNISRRVEHELKKHKAQCSSFQVSSSAEMEEAVQQIQPEVIIAPYMIQKIPDHIFCVKTRPCLIVHPGIPGDRGVTSLDFAIRDSAKTWGVTVLQAEQEYDAGDVWSSDEFPMPTSITKTALYNGPVADAAVKCSLDAVSRYVQGHGPVPVEQAPLRRMKKAYREIDWSMPSADITRLVRMSDTRPGALGQIGTNGSKSFPFRCFDGHTEYGMTSPTVQGLLTKARPGEAVAQRNKALLIKAGDLGGVWIGQMKPETKAPALKLPSVDAIEQNGGRLDVPKIEEACSHDDVRVKVDGDTAYVHFDFYNGAMTTEQAVRLRECLENVAERSDVKVIALMGGERFFSTGINLNTIENSPYKLLEGWSNINAINDVIKEIVLMTDKASVAVLQGNAGAGGAMFAAACDVVVSHPGVLLTPSYRAMNLHGSEYWSYFLPRRVGQATAKRLIDSTDPLCAEEAVPLGLVDHVIGSDKTSFYEELPEFLRKFTSDGRATEIIREKRIYRDSDWRHLIQTHRDFELEQMRNNFRSRDFLTAMHNFVYKK